MTTNISTFSELFFQSISKFQWLHWKPCKKRCKMIPYINIQNNLGAELLRFKLTLNSFHMQFLYEAKRLTCHPLVKQCSWMMGICSMVTFWFKIQFNLSIWSCFAWFFNNFFKFMLLFTKFHVFDILRPLEEKLFLSQ